MNKNINALKLLPLAVIAAVTMACEKQGPVPTPAISGDQRQTLDLINQIEKQKEPVYRVTLDTRNTTPWTPTAPARKP